MTLTQLSKITQKAIILLIGFVIIYLIFTGLLGPLTKNAIIVLFPPKDLPTIGFGLLEPLEFTPKLLQGTPTRFTLNTPNGQLPTNLPTKMLAYKVRPPEFSYEAGRRAQNDAKVLGFEDRNLISDLKGTTYRWRNVESGGVLEIDVNNRTLRLITQLAGKGPYFQTGNLTKQNAINTAKDMFTDIGRFDDSLYISGSQVVKFGKYVGSQVYEVTLEPDAQIARVDFFRSVNQVPILGPDAKKGMLSTVLRRFVATSETPNISPFMNFPVVEAHYWQIDTQSTATYPLIPVADAWKAVTSGSGVVSNVFPKGGNPFLDYNTIKVENVIINNIYMAYYDSQKYQKFMQPVFVFEGNYTTAGTIGGSITYYFPAIQGQYIKQPQVQQQPVTTAK